MIKVKLKKDSNKIKRITIMGHANYDEYGKDIVCASVSSIVILTVNNILTIEKDAISYDDKKGMSINILKDNDIVNILIDNLLKCLNELACDYPKNIIIKEEN